MTIKSQTCTKLKLGLLVVNNIYEMFYIVFHLRSTSSHNLSRNYDKT